jgi:hypothetical protein
VGQCEPGSGAEHQEPDVDEPRRTPGVRARRRRGGRPEHQRRHDRHRRGDQADPQVLHDGHDPVVTAEIAADRDQS